MAKLSIHLPDEYEAALRAQAERHNRKPAVEAAAGVMRELRRQEAAEYQRQLADPGVRDDLAVSAEARAEMRAARRARRAAADA